MKVQAFGEYVIVKHELSKEEDVDGIIVTLEDEKTEKKGVVSSLGPNVEVIREGDTIWFSKFTTVIEKGTDRYLSIHRNDIVAVEVE